MEPIHTHAPTNIPEGPLLPPETSDSRPAVGSRPSRSRRKLGWAATGGLLVTAVCVGCGLVNRDKIGQALFPQSNAPTEDVLGTMAPFFRGIANKSGTDIVGAVQTAIGPSSTPSQTNEPTATSTPTVTATRTSRPTASEVPTPEFLSQSVSQYWAGDNLVGQHKDGVVGAIDLSLLNGYFSDREEQLSLYPNTAISQDYTIAREMTAMKDLNGDGVVDMHTNRHAGFELEHGGLGFTLDSSRPIANGKDELLNINVDNDPFFHQDADGKFRAKITGLSESNIDFGAVQAIRAALALRNPHLNYTTYGDGSALAAQDELIKRAFYKAFAENGFVPNGPQDVWPGAVDLKDVDSIFRDDAWTCVGEMPDAATRALQGPGVFSRVDFITGLEERTNGNDETRDQLDTLTAMEIDVVLDPTNPDFLSSIRFDFIVDSARQDELRPEVTAKLNSIKDDQEVDVEIERGPAAPCAPEVEAPAPAPTKHELPKPNPTTAPRPTETPRSNPSDTPGPGDTPRPTDVPAPTGTPRPIPTDTPRPNDTPTPPLPDTPRPTDTPVPTVTDAPTQPIQPSATVGATETGLVSTPTITPEPHNTPETPVATPTPLPTSVPSNTPVFFP